MHALSHHIALRSDNLTSALARALKTYTTSLADVVGPSLWGLQALETKDLRVDASSALDQIFEVLSFVAVMLHREMTYVVYTALVFGYLASAASF